MNQKAVSIYFRTSDGKGEKIVLDREIGVQKLFLMISRKTNRQVKMLRLFHGSKEIKYSKNMVNLREEEIIHVLVKQNLNSKSSMIKITINWQSKEYGYHLNRLSTISYLKKQMEKDIAEWNRRIILSYLGRELKDQQTLVDAQIQNNSKLSLCMVVNETLEKIQILKPKIAMSLTFQENEQSMGNFYDFQINLVDKNKEKQPSQNSTSQLFLDLKTPWFSGKRIIQTQSVNCDDSYDDDSPDLWINCSFVASNAQKTKNYTFDCLQKHTISDIMKKLAKIQKCENESINWLKKGEIEDMQKSSLLQIARQRTTQTLGPYLFKIKS